VVEGGYIVPISRKKGGRQRRQIIQSEQRGGGGDLTIEHIKGRGKN